MSNPRVEFKANCKNHGVTLFFLYNRRGKPTRKCAECHRNQSRNYKSLNKAKVKITNANRYKVNREAYCMYRMLNHRMKNELL